MTKSSYFNEVLPESNIELKESYQTKHKKIDEEVDSQVNRLSKNNKDALKKEIQNSNETRKVNASFKKDNELSENRNTNTKRTPQKPLTSKNLPNDQLIKVVILGDSIVKHVNGWEILRNLKNCTMYG